MTLVERLRALRRESYPDFSTLDEAADAIEKAERLAEAAADQLHAAKVHQPAEYPDTCVQEPCNSLSMTTGARTAQAYKAKPIPYSAEHRSHLRKSDCGPGCLDYEKAYSAKREGE